MYRGRPTILLRNFTPRHRLRRAAMATSARSYNDAVDALNALQTPYSIVEARRKAGIRPNEKSMREMRAYLARLGYSPADLDRLNIIHVAGTKGKGSTCAFVDSILSQYRRSSAQNRPQKTGLFISPHLIAVRERIRLNSAPISESLFTKYFFEVWDRLGAADQSPEDAPPFSRPSYARYLTLMSWYAFLQEGVDVAVYETGIGGEYDATNLVQRPVASGISALGIDHVFVLGDTVEQIAWHKAGIMKAGCPAFTTRQVYGAEEVLRQRAKEKDVDLVVLGIDKRLEGVKIRPDAQFQKQNASLAIALAETALRKLAVPIQQGAELNAVLPNEFKDGLEKTVFRGRCEIRTEDRVVWYLDGAHTADSLDMSSRWFADETADSSGPRVLIFNQQGRSEASAFLTTIQQNTRRGAQHHSSSRTSSAMTRRGKPSFDCAIFCTNRTYVAMGYKRDFVNHGIDANEVDNMAVQYRFAEKWASIDPGAEVVVLPAIEGALEYARIVGDAAASAAADDYDGLGDRQGGKVQVYVTGSLHLVGGALAILEKSNAL